MFNKLKQFKDLRDQAKQIKDTLGQEHVTLERSGITLTLNGNLEAELVKLNPELDAEKQAEIIKDLFNEAVKKVQRLMAEKMRGMEGLDIPGM